jgi:hypothetical protein
MTAAFRRESAHADLPPDGIVGSEPRLGVRAGSCSTESVAVMVVMIDCHTDTPAHEIEPQEWLALIRISDSRTRRELHPDWRFLLELDTNHSEGAGSPIGMTPERSQVIAKFWEQLTRVTLPLALVIRGGHDRAWSAGVAKALGEAGGLYVPIPSIDYDRNAYQLLATELRSTLRAARRNSVLNRIRAILGQS